MIELNVAWIRHVAVLLFRICREHSNETKGDQTRDVWLPPKHDCRYLREFVSVKLRWELTVTRAEKKAIRSLAAGCRNVRVLYEPAPVRR